MQVPIETGGIGFPGTAVIGGSEMSVWVLESNSDALQGWDTF